MQWDVDNDWTLSLLLRSPEMLLTKSANGATLQSTSLVVPGVAPLASFTIDKANLNLGAFSVVAPARIVGGVARRIGDGTWVSAEVDVQTPFSNDLSDDKLVVNGRAGATVRLNEKFSVGLGAYTDFAPQRALGDTFGDERVDEFGGTAGVEIRTPLSLKDRPDPDALVLSTTLALKYGVGLGQFRAVDVDLTGNSNPPPRAADVVYHTILPYIGSSILF